MDDKYSTNGGAAAAAASSSAVVDETLSSSGMRVADTLLRLASMGLCVAALIVMLKNSQTDDYGSVAYSDLGAFKFLVHVNGICAGYSFLSAVVAAMSRPSTMSKAWTLFFLDQLLTYITLAAGTVSTEVLYLAYNGDTEITWSAACGSFGKFCSKATASVVITFVVVAFYAFISILSSYKLFGRYSAPMPDPSKQLEISAFSGRC
ncbi:CASP-like protein 2A1 [Cucurbita pepo subsp. pepo]|uniref:CASP-like protein 2A1 n=1 Tax=Cucurbita pepo subsp. pepo TaxID=3664 RepID=UPI000C9D5CEF|nr:CASP-like protein 2A1 [Cucurbita pepo subsp. pepo]